MLRGGFSMRGYLSIIKGAAAVALFFLSFSVFADTYPAHNNYRCGSVSGSSYSESCQTYAQSLGDNYGTAVNEVCSVRRNSDNVLLSSFSCWIQYTCPYGGTVSGSSCIDAPSCPSGETRNITTGACDPPPPPECDLGKVLQPDGQSCACPSGQYQRFGAPDPNACGVPSCPSGYYINLTVADGYYDCTVQPPDCPLPVPMCSSPSYECMGEASTPTTIPSCDNTCPAGHHASGGSCVPDEQEPVQCPPNYTYNVALSSCESSPPIVCQEGYKAGKVNGESVCVASTTGTPTQIPTKNTATTNTTIVTTTTIYDSNGDPVQTAVSTSNGTSTTEIDTSGLAQDSTVKAVLDTLTGTADRGGETYTGGSGSGVPQGDGGAAVAAKRGELQAMISGIKAQFNGLMPMVTGSGSLACDGGVDLPWLGAHFEICLANFSDQLSLIGYGVYFVAAVLSVFVILS